MDALPGSKMDMGEELWADEYWNGRWLCACVPSARPSYPALTPRARPRLHPRQLTAHPLTQPPARPPCTADPRIHSFGNVGAGGMFHAIVAPIFTKGLDMFAYNDTDLRTLATLNIAASRAENGLPTQRVVDIGCGIGASSRALRNVFREADIVALDTSSEMLGVARTLGYADMKSKALKKIEFANGNAEYVGAWGPPTHQHHRRHKHHHRWSATRLSSLATNPATNPAPNESHLARYTGLRPHDFDVVSVMFLLHEAPQAGRKSILAEAKRLLKPGGTLVICDIAREYTPSATMKSGEPYIDGYLANVEDDIRSAGFKSVAVSQPIPGRAEMWECQVPTLKEEEELLAQERLRRVSRPMVSALGEFVGRFR